MSCPSRPRLSSLFPRRAALPQLRRLLYHGAPLLVRREPSLVLGRLDSDLKYFPRFEFSSTFVDGKLLCVNQTVACLVLTSHCYQIQIWAVFLSFKVRFRRLKPVDLSV